MSELPPGVLGTATCPTSVTDDSLPVCLLVCLAILTRLRSAGLGASGRRRNVLPLGNWHLIERRMSKFLREPPSVRGAAGTIVFATAAVVVIGGILMRAIDHTEYSNIWVGMWWAMQTVTTVGYGDAVPTSTTGRLIAALVMIGGIGFLTVITAAITSTFIENTRRRLDGDTSDALSAKLDQLNVRLDVIDTALRDLRGGDQRP